jgi:site-specific DNA-methyltransferase (adenine-specific)
MNVLLGDCLTHLKLVPSESVDLVYLDPPFFTNRSHSATTRDRNQVFSFSDSWNDLTEYAEFMRVRLIEIHRVLKETGSIFLHCDKSANFLLRVLLNQIFTPEQFRSEIIWSYKRWSNSAKGLLPAHQTIFFYSKSNKFKFNQSYGAYSETTNIDQILQRRSRDEHGISNYAKNNDGTVIYDHQKQGVPLSDVWEIPFLNPKAKERTGYPTQKPIILLERIVELTTDVGDVVLDPFCGSGTTLVAAKFLARNAIGIDESIEAVTLTQKRLQKPERTESALLKKGRSAYENADKEALALLGDLDIVPVHRNFGMDGLLRANHYPDLIPIRVQRSHETLVQAAQALTRAAQSKSLRHAILVRTNVESNLFEELELPTMLMVINATSLQVKQCLEDKLQSTFSISS